jgi:peptide/nickel transport system permease protein
MGLTQVGIAIPNFWFAILLILLSSRCSCKWFSAGGFPKAGRKACSAGTARRCCLPALSLAVVQAAILARITRSAVLEVLREDFVRTARAKGVSQRAVLWGHVLRNALDPGDHRDGPAVRRAAWRAPSWWRACSTCRAWAG